MVGIDHFVNFFLVASEEAGLVYPVFLAASFLDVSFDQLHRSCALDLNEQHIIAISCVFA